MGDLKKVLIQRLETSDEGTYGKLSTLGFECYTAELPDRDNADNLSRIPAGTYVCRWTQSNHRKNPDGSREWSYQIMDVPGREGIRVHAGNFAGDRTRGYAADVEGCTLLGRAINEAMEIPEKKRAAHASITHVKQKGVTSSRDTVAAFAEHMNKDPFELTVADIAA